jgi:hypothetical protein
MAQLYVWTIARQIKIVTGDFKTTALYESSAKVHNGEAICPTMPAQKIFMKFGNEQYTPTVARQI